MSICLESAAIPVPGIPKLHRKTLTVRLGSRRAHLGHRPITPSPSAEHTSDTPSKEKSLHFCKPLKDMVAEDGIEPSTQARPQSTSGLLPGPRGAGCDCSDAGGAGPLHHEQWRTRCAPGREGQFEKQSSEIKRARCCLRNFRQQHARLRQILFRVG